ncbi:hypothetical protein [Pendulispora albinea]|uniref:Secreted protein n=1 Tax=Pendulispora albinea TaxID=2741071 RepID=A0ABZ2M3S9_9BACT
MTLGKVAMVSGWKNIVIGAGVFGLALSALMPACYDPPEKNPGRPEPPPGQKCSAPPGEFPNGNCDDSANECTQDSCKKISENEALCGSPTTCMPLDDNKGKETLDLRIRRLHIISPKTLAKEQIEAVVVTGQMDLKESRCGEVGTGSFNWLLRVTHQAGSNTGTVETGGAPPSDDPFGKGFCFYNHTTPSGIAVSPQKVNATFTGNEFTSDKFAKLNVPIFVGGDKNNAIVLPLTNMVMNKVVLSDDNNCVGKFDLKALDSDCLEAPKTCTKWKTSASLGGFITLEEADNVNVKDLGSSLCVVLADSPKGEIKDGFPRCPRNPDGSLKLEESQRGDYCSGADGTPPGPGGCRDSFWLSATFAASAATIHDGSGVAECNP